MTIGDFSRAVRLTAKALRFYHRSGVLVPAHVDERNGYRLYAAAQIADAQIVKSLRDLDVPVEAVREVLATPDVARRGRLIANHLEGMERRLEETRTAVASLRSMIDRPDPRIEITHRSVPETRVVAVREVIELPELGTWFRRALATLQGIAAHADPATVGAFGGVWSNDLFADERGEALLHVVAHPGFDERVLGSDAVMTELPAIDLAVATHDGDDATIGRVYAALGEHVAAHELTIEAPVRETYITGFPGLDERSVTEIGWPIFRVFR